MSSKSSFTRPPSPKQAKSNVITAKLIPDLYAGLARRAQKLPAGDSGAFLAALVGAQDKDVLKSLARLAGSQDESVAIRAVSALHRTNDADVVTAILVPLDRDLSAGVLSPLGSAVATTLDGSPDPRIRARAIALVRCGWPSYRPSEWGDEFIVESWRHNRRRPGGWLQNGAVPAEIRELYSLLSHPNPAVREAAIGSLSGNLRPGIERELIWLAESALEPQAVRIAAIDVLGQANLPDVREYLDRCSKQTIYDFNTPDSTKGSEPPANSFDRAMEEAEVWGETNDEFDASTALAARNSTIAGLGFRPSVEQELNETADNELGKTRRSPGGQGSPWHEERKTHFRNIAEQQAAALRSMALFDDDWSFSCLSDMMESSQLSMVSAAMIGGLARQSDPARIPLLEHALLNSPCASARLAAAKGLGMAGHGADVVLMQRALADASFEVRVATAVSMLEIGNTGRMFVKTRAIHGNTPAERASAIFVAGCRDVLVEAAAVKVLHESSHSVFERAAMVGLLRCTTSEPLVRALIELLNNHTESGVLRRCAANALSGNTSKLARDALADGLHDEGIAWECAASLLSDPELIDDPTIFLTALQLVTDPTGVIDPHVANAMFRAAGLIEGE